MKKVFKFLPIAAIVFGSGLALATTTKMDGPNVYKDPVTGEWENLSPQYPPGSYHCPGAGECTAYRDEHGNISKIEPGVFTPRED